MSPWNLGVGDESEEILMDMSNREGQIATQQDPLVDNPLDETFYKLRSVLEPNTDVVTCIERLLNTIDRLRGERDSLSRDVEFLESESRFTIEALEAKLSASVSSSSDETVATITQLRIEMDEKERHLQDVESERDSLKLQITNLMTDMQDVQEELNNAEGRYTTLQFHQLSDMTNSEATRNLRGQIEELENRVMRRTEQIGIHQHDIKRLETNLRLQEERLSEMTTELEMMAAQKDAMVEDCADAREARDEALIRVERLEEELENSEGRNVKRLETNLRLQEERLSEMTTELEMMAAQKDAMVEDCASAREARDEALLRVEQLEEELESSDGRNADNTVIVESLIATIAQTVCQARETIRLSREEYTTAQDAYQRTIQEANSSNLELEQQLGVATEKLAELELLREQYNDLKKEHAEQQSRLQGELTKTSRYHQDLELSRGALQDENARLTEDLTRIQKEHATQIDRCREESRAAEQELEQQMTELEAEVQRSKSLIHHLEIQIKDSDQLVSILKGDIERTKADLARSEKLWKTAEVNLSLQNAQRKREMTELERELSAFRSMPNLEQALAELEERNSEMEQLLRNKCVEIEENDDRALEMLKEKKKLTSKVESLTRKVQNLQAKVTAARASAATQPYEFQPALPASLPLTSSTPQSTSVPISSRSRSATVPSAPPLYPPPIETPSTWTTQNPSNRVVSGPSFLPRPKTPERRTVTPVFKARTPERKMQPEILAPIPAPVIGKKRAAPDDFGAYGNLPAQAFTADAEDIENKALREQKVSNGVQSGFTPVRNQSSRPIAPSPRRGALSRTSPFISDLTNSPHHLTQMNPSSAKPSKRGWLGKIRGNSHATDRSQAPGMRPMSLFDRGE